MSTASSLLTSCLRGRPWRGAKTDWVFPWSRVALGISPVGKRPGKGAPCGARSAAGVVIGASVVVPNEIGSAEAALSESEARDSCSVTMAACCSGSCCFDLERVFLLKVSSRSDGTSWPPGRAAAAPFLFMTLLLSVACMYASPLLWRRRRLTGILLGAYGNPIRNLTDARKSPLERVFDMCDLARIQTDRQTDRRKFFERRSRLHDDA
ncbi:MAG: hypothetical protein BJ554DRAFT_7309, partial [Olpidium bornovanus]